MHRLLLFFIGSTMIIGLSLASGSGFAQDKGDAPVSAFDDSFSLSAAAQSGIPITWRADRRNGRVSVCFVPRRGSGDVVCSDWSAKAPQAARSNYSINAETSAVAGLAWVWRINTVTGLVSYCSVPCCTTDIPNKRPQCAEMAAPKE